MSVSGKHRDVERLIKRMMVMELKTKEEDEEDDLRD